MFAASNRRYPAASPDGLSDDGPDARGKGEWLPQRLPAQGVLGEDDCFGKLASRVGSKSVTPVNLQDHAGLIPSSRMWRAEMLTDSDGEAAAGEPHQCRRRSARSLQRSKPIVDSAACNYRAATGKETHKSTADMTPSSDAFDGATVQEKASPQKPGRTMPPRRNSVTAAAATLDRAIPWPRRAYNAAMRFYEMVVLNLFLADAPEDAVRHRYVIIQAMIVFLAISVGFIAVTVTSFIRLAGDSVTLEVTSTTYKGTHPLPRFCVERADDTTYTTFLYRTIYDQYDGGETEVELEKETEELNVNGGVDVTVECPIAADNGSEILVEGAFEDPVYTFVTVKIFSLADNSSVVEDSYANLWVQNFPLPYNPSSTDWISFHQTFGSWMGVRLESFFIYAQIALVNKFTITESVNSLSKFDRGEFRLEAPPVDLAEDELCAFYLRSAQRFEDITQRQYSIVDAGSAAGGMWSLFILVASWYFVAYFKARESACIVRTQTDRLRRGLEKRTDKSTSRSGASRSSGDGGGWGFKSSAPKPSASFDASDLASGGKDADAPPPIVFAAPTALPRECGEGCSGGGSTSGESSRLGETKEPLGNV